ncbi:disulfide bond formation protein B [Candidatus Woesearchaeota archaeon]|nr:disulfide bond formation protein B [Candidatus Woesearchaeota archaeon]
MPFVASVKLALAGLTVAGLAFVLIYFASLAGRKSLINYFLRKNGLKLAFLVTVAATAGSLFFSEIAHYEPCRLCWYQRTMMYPLVLMFGIALWKKANDVFKYALALSVAGAAIAAYHYGLQVYAKLTPGFTDSCSATSVSCAAAPSWTFGFVTIPLMSLVAFIMVALICITSMRSKAFAGRR